MRLKEFKALLRPIGQEALMTAVSLSPSEVDFLSHFQKLNKKYDREIARAALETGILRRDARTKFPFAERMYFTREALQQASSWEIGTHRAQRYADFDMAIDLGCSIGSDTLALAQVVPSFGVDQDPLRLHMARANAKALELPAQFIQAEMPHLPLAAARPNAAAYFFDPARRTAQRRAFSVAEYTPPLSMIKGWLQDRPALGVKISPGVDLAELLEYDCEVEFISLRGELKEAVLWFGPMKTAEKRATLLPGPNTFLSLDGAEIPVSEPAAYLYEPDPAILRAGLVRPLGVELDAAQLDPQIAYLTANELVETPFARAWRIEEWLPFNLKRLRAHLRAGNVGRVTVKKRGSPVTPEQLIRALRLRGEVEKVLVLTQLRGKPIVLICAPRD